MGAQFSQIFPPTPTLTDKNLPSQKGRTFVVTGGYSGVGLELTRILYAAGGHVYIAGRNQSKAEEAIDNIASATGRTEDGALEFLQLDLADLTTIKASADRLLKKDVAIDVLFNNAGVGNVLPNAVSAQGIEVQLAVNVLGTYLFTRLIEPCLIRSASKQPTQSSARVVWTCSQAIDLLVPKGGELLTHATSPLAHQHNDLNLSYAYSKLGHWYLATEFGRRVGTATNILSIPQNPGGLRTNFFRDKPWWFSAMLWPLLHPAKMGAYTEMYAGLSEELNIREHQGTYVVPWGRLHAAPRADLLAALKEESEGGTGEAARLWDWCEEMTTEYR